MTAAEILRSAQPPADDGMIEKAIAELDLKIWEWTDALKSAQTQLRSAFATRPLSRPSAVLYEGVTSLSAAAAAAHVPTPPTPPQWSTLSAAAAAAHVPTPPTPPEWSAPPPSEAAAAQVPAPAPPPWSAPPTVADGSWATAAAPSATTPAAFQNASANPANEWPARPAPQHGGHGMQDQAPETGGAMSWPTATTGNWPEASSSAPATGAQVWPTWTPSDPSANAADAKKTAGGSSVRATKAPKAVRPTLPEGPSPEERAKKAAVEEALLSGLEEAVARRVRLLRRLDPDTPIEKLIEKARQGQTEAPSPASAKDDKSSWWRRK